MKHCRPPIRFFINDNLSKLDPLVVQDIIIFLGKVVTRQIGATSAYHRLFSSF